MSTYAYLSNLETLGPRGFGTGCHRVASDRLQSTLEEEQHTVHDSHDEVRRSTQFADCGWKGGEKGKLVRCIFLNLLS